MLNLGHFIIRLKKQDKQMMKLTIFNNYCGYDDIFP
jgi:hypothetical protein